MKTVKRDDGFIRFVILAVYVDDIIPVFNDVLKCSTQRKNPYAKNLKPFISEKFTSSLECQSKVTELLAH